MSLDMARHRARRPSWLWVVPSLLIPLTVAAVAWADHVGSHGDAIAPNVRFAGIDLSGMSADDVADMVSEREDEFLRTPLTLDLGADQITMTAEELGYDYLWADTVDSAISARHGEGPVSEFFSWVTTPLGGVVIEDRYELNADLARQRLSATDLVLTLPVEPEITNQGASYLYTLPGVNGEGIDIEATIEALGTAEIHEGPKTIEVPLAVIEPSVTDEKAQALALALNDKTREGMLAFVEGHHGRIASGQIRNHLTSVVEDGTMTASIDVDGFQGELESVFHKPVGEFTPPHLEVFDGNVTVIAPGETPPICCDRDSVAWAAEHYLDQGSAFYQFKTRSDDDPTVVAWADGSQVNEVVAEFTTRHPCCENRVTNIQTMADALTGVYMVPGETLSLNEFVGPRTRAKGYLPAGAIRGGYMTDEVGGGVSQFVTTMFNAAFFGGLELDEYQSHSVYFSRYPFGREATLSIPGPDLVFTNTTDFPVLIWPTYDANSITVTLYSTKHIEVEELEQRIWRRRQCTSSAIDRQRIYPDGRVVVDTIYANYRPANGIDCNGNVIPQR